MLYHFHKGGKYEEKILITVSAVIIIAIALFLFLNIRGNVKVEKGTIRITKLDEANFGNVDNLKETYESLQNDSLAQKIRKNDIFKSDSIDDYILVGVSLDIKTTVYSMRQKFRDILSLMMLIRQSYIRKAQ